MMGDQSYAEYRDDRSKVIGVARVRAREEQTRQHARVSKRTAAAIVEWFEGLGIGAQFRADELRAHVHLTVGPVAPGSPDRIMRSLKQQGVIAYELVSRAQSLYKITTRGPTC